VTHSLIEEILKPGGLSVAFQPIFEVSDGVRRLHAVEGLVRGPKHTNLENADVLFEYVRRRQEEAVVDRACDSAALKAARSLPSHVHLSLNVHASTLGRDLEFVPFLIQAAQTAGMDLARLVVEIVEHTPFWDGRNFRMALDRLRERGTRIALDDVGLGQSNYRMILDCRPDYFKIDRYFVQGVRSDFYRQAVLESVAMLARKFGGRVVAEGVEEALDLDAVTSLGIDLIQGFLFSPPRSADELLAGDLLEEYPTRRSWRRTPEIHG
jgi:EAL domain-containing protein (putative c-di-GMP-specific phosphodiesterase class I)